MKIKLSILILFCALKLTATHIIGGVITYKYISDNNYNFTLKIYRDCSVSSQFSNTITVPAYLGTRKVPFLTKDAMLTSSSIIKIKPPIFPCVIVPNNVCVEEATYNWSMNLPKSNESYFVSYQVCCRNGTISNVINPSLYGGTFTTEITPNAQKLDNSSPEFNIFPPTAICANTPLEFNNAATDADGDQLIYEFCTPLEGILLNGTRCLDKNTNAEIACPPPYPGILYANGYTVLDPLGINSFLKIDPNTGIITGTPTEIGQYVVGICVKEIRNGIFIGMTTRDFQFNVIQCDKSVVGMVESDGKSNRGEFLIKSCNMKNITLKNKSHELSYIKDFYWEFDFDLSKKYREWNPTIEMPDTGTFTGRLILNPNIRCTDTAKVLVIFSYANEAKINILYDTCFADKPVVFAPVLDTTKNKIKNFSWSIENQKDTLANPLIYRYYTTGKKNIKLKTENIHGCKATVERDFYWKPAPNSLFLKPNTFTLCSPATFNMSNFSSPMDTTYTVEWNFDDGQKGIGHNVSHTFVNAGTYSIGLKITSPLGCIVETRFPELLKVHQSSKSIFDIEPSHVNIENPTVTLNNQSTGAENTSWLIDYKDYTDKFNPIYHFQDTGMHTILLVTRNKSGCLDSLRKSIYVYPVRKWFLPNAFTPNQDSRNDEYKGKGKMDETSHFEMQIYNDWGALVFYTDNPNIGWNGQVNNNGETLPEGKYIVKVSYLDYDNSPKSLISNVFLIK